MAHRQSYGPHLFPTEGVGSCKYGCGCENGTGEMSPMGLDPKGLCPNNHLDGTPSRGVHDVLDIVVEQNKELRRQLEEAKSQAERADALKAQAELAEHGMSELKKELNQAYIALAEANGAIDRCFKTSVVT